MDLGLEFEAWRDTGSALCPCDDNFQPLLLNHENDGKRLTRHECGFPSR